MVYRNLNQRHTKIPFCSLWDVVIQLVQRIQQRSQVGFQDHQTSGEVEQKVNSYLTFGWKKFDICEIWTQKAAKKLVSAQKNQPAEVEAILALIAVQRVQVRLRLNFCQPLNRPGSQSVVNQFWCPSNMGVFPHKNIYNNHTKVVFFFPECVARVPVSFGGLGVRLCSRKVVSMFATVRNRPQPFAWAP